MNKIYIISLSPAFDYILKFDNLIKNKTNRPKETQMYPAGKGIHISMILNSLETNNESLIFSGGNLESYFYKELDKEQIQYKKFKSLGDIRINLKLIDYEQTECSVLSPGIDINEINKLKEYLKTNVQEKDFIIMAGSIPTGVDNSIYSEIVELANSIGAKAVVDSFGESLLKAIYKKPFLIKPNIEELSITTGIEIKNNQDIINAGNSLLDMGVENILVSAGSDGAFFINKDIVLHSTIGKWNKTLVNAAGAGDSMLGGFISEYIKTNNFNDALIMGIVCGSATAYTDKIANEENIKELLWDKKSIVVKKLVKIK